MVESKTEIKLRNIKRSTVMEVGFGWVWILEVKFYQGRRRCAWWWWCCMVVGFGRICKWDLVWECEEEGVMVM